MVRLVIAVLGFSVVVTSALAQATSGTDSPKTAALLARIDDPRWRVIYASDDQVVALDTKRLTSSRLHRYAVWTRYLFSAINTWEGIRHDEFRAKLEVDCSAGGPRFRRIVRTFYAERNSGVTETFTNAQWEETVPQTVGEDVFSAACEYLEARFAKRK